MAFDGLFSAAVARELNKWAGARIEKVYQSSATCFYFQIYHNGNRGNFVISASASRPILAITNESVARPDTPTPVCMLYRKHLQNGRLVSAEWVENERIIRFSVDCADEMGYIRRKHIYAEMMGKYSNIILTDENDKILSAGSTSDITSGVRRIMPGLPYELPPKQDKISVFAIEKGDFVALCDEKAGMTAADFLLRSFLGFSPVVARELAFSAFGNSEEIVSKENGEILFAQIERLKEIFKNDSFTPVGIYDGEDGVEYSFLPLTQYGEGYETKIYESFSQLLTDYFGKKEEAVNIGRYSRELVKTVNNHLSRARKKLVLLKGELEDCSAMEKMRIRGDVITANIYRIRQGDSSFTGMDYESGEDITVPLDVSLAPAKNAQKYYKKYSKMKRASVVLAEQIKQTEMECSYLESVLSFIDRAANPQELAEIKLELSEGKYLSDKSSGGNGKKKKTPAAKPLSFKTTDGLTLRVGRNNRQNDALTGGADRNEIWFHIKGFHGSHVILTPNGNEEPTDRDYTEALMIAAYYSEKRGSRNVEVDYTRVRNLKKPNGSAPGFVTYEKYYSAVVDAIDPFAQK